MSTLTAGAIRSRRSHKVRDAALALFIAAATVALTIGAGLATGRTDSPTAPTNVYETEDGD